MVRLDLNTDPHYGFDKPFCIFRTGGADAPVMVNPLRRLLFCFFGNPGIELGGLDDEAFVVGFADFFHFIIRFQTECQFPPLDRNHFRLDANLHAKGSRCHVLQVHGNAYRLFTGLQVLVDELGGNPFHQPYQTGGGKNVGKVRIELLGRIFRLRRHRQLMGHARLKHGTHNPSFMPVKETRKRTIKTKPEWLIQNSAAMAQITPTG